jgi:hypothetical protein
MNLKNRSLVETLGNRPAKDFPGGVKYKDRYAFVSDFLLREVHPNVPIGAALTDGNFLNDHGPKHIETVIGRASQLVEFAGCKLSAYEIYILLVAIQIHDVGNILGRTAHEKKPRELDRTLHTLMGPDAIEKRLIFDIGEAHGGDINGDKDTIGQLPQYANVLNHKVRPQHLAAILRLADELADDRTRAARFSMELGVVPGHCMIYHKYSEALHSVMIDEDAGEVQLEFEITVPDVLQTFPKQGGSLFLIEEVYHRTRKLHFERIYCMRFLRPDIALSRESVTVNICPEGYGKPIRRLGWRLEEKGYPDAHQTIYEMCPELVTGESLKAEIQAQTGVNSNGAKG